LVHYSVVKIPCALAATLGFFVLGAVFFVGFALAIFLTIFAGYFFPTTFFLEAISHFYLFLNFIIISSFKNFSCFQLIKSIEFN
jgi:hypothetical protein